MRETLSVNQKNTLKRLVQKQDLTDIQKAINNVMTIVKNQLSIYFDGMESQTAAFVTSYACQLAVDNGNLSVSEFMAKLAEAKAENYSKLNDKGAIGDLVEILVRLCLIKAKLRRSCHLHVKEQGRADIVSKRLGVIEVGHNGKSWTQGDLFDFMAGDFEAVIYGMLDDYDTKEIVTYCKGHEYEKAISYVAANFGYWADKYEYQHFMDNLSRGKGVTVKAGEIQTVYNAGKYNAFQDAIENGQIHMLEELI